MKIQKNFMLIVAIIFLFTSCQDNKKKDSMENGTARDSAQINNPIKKETRSDQQTIEENRVGDVIESSEKHTTLLAAMEDAGIIVKLKSNDPYTVFAPTDAAFSELPKGTIDALMKPDNAKKLEGILSYHIIPGIVDSSKLIDLIKSSEDNEYILVTANNGKLKATINDAGNVIITDATGDRATVVAADMMASNGVVHSINSVLMRN